MVINLTNLILHKGKYIADIEEIEIIVDFKLYLLLFSRFIFISILFYATYTQRATFCSVS